MKEITERTLSARPDSECDDINPRAAGRRRLLRAIGGSGVALSAVLTSRWQQPVVETVVLPAHAQTTNANTEQSSSGPNQNQIAATGCVLSITSIFQAGPATPADQLQTYQIIVQGTSNGSLVTSPVLAQATHSGTGTIALTATLELGDGPASFAFGNLRTMTPAPANVEVTYSAECCGGANTSGQITIVAAGTSSGGIGSGDPLVVVQGGVCSFG